MCVCVCLLILFCRYLFLQYDTDNSGGVSVQELRDHFEKELNFGPVETEEMFQAFGYDNSSENEHDMNLQEFKQFYRQLWDTSAL